MADTIGNRIKKLRENKGITQLELAKALDVQRETVNRWENDTRDLKTEYTITLADYFGVTCDYILRGIKAENVKVNSELGLTDISISRLKQLNKFHNTNKSFFTNVVNRGYEGCTDALDVLDVINILLKIEYNSTDFWDSEGLSMCLNADKSNSDILSLLTDIINLYICQPQKIVLNRDGTIETFNMLEHGGYSQSIAEVSSSELFENVLFDKLKRMLLSLREETFKDQIQSQ